MGDDKFFLIVAEGIDNTQRELIQHLIKAEADDWWHELLDVWIVRGGLSASNWRARLSVFVPAAPSGIMVFGLPTLPAEREIAFRMPKGSARTKWLYEVYKGSKVPSGRAAD
ncbi:hypothetical protein ACQPYV_31925 [Micromonospora saelicesensis]|uniref:hypothetical protein n=1 Tax=Micromonospora saelicesensis TaxID=285676 RepID=UPI003D8E6D49